MPTPKLPSKRNETTSSGVASLAGSILGGVRLQSAEAWLTEVSCSPAATEAERDHAVTLLGALKIMRSVAASALTQRG